MNGSPLRKHDLRHRRLMRRGLLLTGIGLVCLLLGVGLMIQMAAIPLPALVLVLCSGLGLTTIGFGIMVVAADPFGEDELQPTELADPRP